MKGQIQRVVEQGLRQDIMEFCMGVNDFLEIGAKNKLLWYLRPSNESVEYVNKINKEVSDVVSLKLEDRRVKKWVN